MRVTGISGHIVQHTSERLPHPAAGAQRAPGRHSCSCHAFREAIWPPHGEASRQHSSRNRGCLPVVFVAWEHPRVAELSGTRGDPFEGRHAVKSTSQKASRTHDPQSASDPNLPVTHDLGRLRSRSDCASGARMLASSLVRQLRNLADPLSVFRNNIDEGLAQTHPRDPSSCRLFRFRNRVPEICELFRKGFSMNLDASFAR